MKLLTRMLRTESSIASSVVWVAVCQLANLSGEGAHNRDLAIAALSSAAGLVRQVECYPFLYDAVCFRKDTFPRCV